MENPTETTEQPQAQADPQVDTAEPRAANPFTGQEILPAPGTQVAQIEGQRAVANVLATMVHAQRYPRNERASYDRILMAFTRPSLAESGLYQYARGGTNIEGLSIRAAEEIARLWGNMRCGVTEISRNRGVSECLAYAVDLETNYHEEKTFQVKHWRDTRQGGYQITDERDVYELIANMGARRKRACILAVIPGDVREAVERQINVTLTTKGTMTPERIKKMLADFAELKVTQKQIETRIQRNIEALIDAPALVVSLGKIFNSIRDGMSKAEDWFPPEEVSEGAEETGTGTAGKVKAALAARKKTGAE